MLRCVALTYFLLNTGAYAGPVEDFKAALLAKERGDYATSIRLLNTLAEQDISGAYWALGVMYFEGKGVVRDYAKAAELYRRAANRGHPFAQYELGVLFDRGLGLTRNVPEAAKWFERASAQGHGMAQFNLAVLYGTGEGVPLDLVESYKWFSIAARGGGIHDQENVRGEAARRRNIVASRLSLELRSLGDSRASGWRRIQEMTPEPRL